MGYNFPDTPTIGQVFTGYVWDGQAWQVQGAAASGAVRYDIAQSLTAAQQVQARQNVYAAPFDALAYNGMQINGSMDVSQERGTTATTVSGSYIADGWMLFTSGTGVVGAAQTSASAGPFLGYVNCIGLYVTTAQAVMGAGDFYIIQQRIEGWRVARLAWGTANAQPLTIGFWSAHTRTGVYSITVRNGASNRTYSTTYTQSASNVAQFNVIAVPGDTTGTWTTDNTVGLVIVFAVASGSSSIAGSANVWFAGFAVAAPGQINGIAALTDNFRLTGVVVLPGIEAPSAARSPLIMRPYDQELATCQRYYSRLSPANGNFVTSGMVYNSTLALFPVRTSLKMRADPTVTISALADYIIVAGAAFGALSNITAAVSLDLIRLDCATSGLTTGQAAVLQANTANAKMTFDARL